MRLDFYPNYDETYLQSNKYCSLSGGSIAREAMSPTDPKYRAKKQDKYMMYYNYGNDQPMNKDK